MLLAMIASLSMLRFGVGDLGIFDGRNDVGECHIEGKSSFDKDSKVYGLTASGADIWSSKDAFHFVWRKVTGDSALSAAIEFVGKGKNEHRKACLMIRESLSADSPYADIAVHGSGLTSMQFREARGGETHEIQSLASAPHEVGIQRIGQYVTVSLGSGENRTQMGGAVRLNLGSEYYIGLALCSHEADVAEEARFSQVKFEVPDTIDAKLVCTLETIDISNFNRKIAGVFIDHIEAPNWTPDGKELIYNSNGSLYRIPASGGTATKIDTGFANRCNNDHGISPDGKWIAISDHSENPHQSTIYVLPSSGGTPRKVLEGTPSYWHGWSPDGKTLAFCGQRDGKFGIFTVPVEGGKETRLTTAEKLDDGPDYSPDGQFIYFNSDRTGKMQIYQMRTDGSEVVRLTQDENNNWFAHPSPDGKWIVFLAYEPDVDGHPANKDVELRLMDLKDRSTKTIARFFGGQGTINVPSWSPDSKRLAYVSYQLVP